jgi:hypothetical protein
VIIVCTLLMLITRDLSSVAQIRGYKSTLSPYTYSPCLTHLLLLLLLALTPHFQYIVLMVRRPLIFDLNPFGPLHSFSLTTTYSLLF